MIRTTAAKFVAETVVVLCGTLSMAQGTETSVTSESQNLNFQPAGNSALADRPPSSPLAGVGSWEFAVWARQAVGNDANGEFGNDAVSQAGLRVGYVFARPSIHGRVRGSLEYFFDIVPVFLMTKPQTIYGGGFSPVGMKWNFFNYRQSYIALSGGGILSTRNVPPGNTSSLNFTVSASAGMNLWTHARQSFGVSAGYWHLSNARMGDSNPSLNTMQFGIEYRWCKPK